MNAYLMASGIGHLIRLLGMASPPGASGGQSASPFQFLPMIAIVLFIFYFLSIRPQQRKQKEQKETLASLRKGDQVITLGGIHGVIAGVKDDVVVVKVADNVKIEFSKSAITTITKREAEPS